MKIWDYIDPDKAKNETKENIEPVILSIAAAPTAIFTILVITPAALAAVFAMPVIDFAALVVTPTAIKIVIFALLN